MHADAEAPGYTRRPHQEDRRTRIASTCDLCGFRIVGNAPDIQQDEWDHREKCFALAEEGKSRAKAAD